MFQDPTLATLAAYVASIMPSLASVAAADAAIDTDVEFMCTTSRIAAQTAADVGVPVWRYFFNSTFPNTERAGYGVYHSAEVSLVFGAFNASTATAAERALSDAMQAAWAGFAKDPWGEDPWGEGRPDGYAVAALNLDGVAVIRNEKVDGNCWIYQSIYDGASGGTPWW
jgi:carboxylesterase type B